MPFNSRPGTFRSRGCSAPPASRMASKLAAKIFDGNVSTDVRVGDELHAFGRHLFEAAIDDVLFQLEVRNAVAQQSADAICLFVDRDRMAGAA